MAISGLEAQLTHERLVVPEVGSFEDLVDLTCCLLGLEALLDHI